MAANPKAQRAKKVTLLEIAREAQVSKSTVSLVLNNAPNAFPISPETRERVMKAAETLGYRPNAAAKALATGRSNTILMVAFDLWDENLVERLRGVEASLVPQGYSVRVCTVDSSGRLAAYSEILRTGQADGVLLTGLATPDTYAILRDLDEEAKTADVPVVALASAFPPEFVDVTANIDDEGGAEQAVTHLIEHGHRRIMLLGVADQQWAERREQGYQTALTKAGIPIDPDLILLGNRSQTWAYNATIEAASKDFTAMFAVTDNMALAALSALREVGKRVPDDCAIIGFDNNEAIAKYADPPLTTVDNPFFESGKLAGKHLLDLIAGRPIEQATLPTSLVIRQSCGCKPD